MTRILFLAANPKGTPRTRLDEEIRTIEERIRLAEMRDLFDVKQEWALRTSDLQRTLLQHKPEIVHFAGMGTPSGEIIMEDKSGRNMPVSAKGVGELFSILKDDIQCVIINSCYSRTQARAIARHVDFVIGWSQAVSDYAAITFAAAFYQALGFGRTMKTAFDLACNQLRLEGLHRGAFPVLLLADHDRLYGRRRRSFSGKDSLNRLSKPSRDDTTAIPKASTVTRPLPRHLDVDSFVSSERFMKGRSTVTDPSRVNLLNSVLLSRLNDGGSSERSETARQLGYLRDPAAVPILEMRWPLEPDPTVRYWLAVALGCIGGDQAYGALIRLRQTEEDQFAQSGLDEAISIVTHKEIVQPNGRRIAS